MPVFINANYTGWFAEIARRQGGRGFSRDGKRLLLREANRKVIDVWHGRFIRRHFLASAAGRYHYQRRKKKYRGIKVRLASGDKVFIRGKEIDAEVIRKGGRVDFVRGGKTEASANVSTAITATAGGAKTRVQVPGYVSRKKAGQPDQKKELQTLTSAERGRLTQVWKGQFLRDAKRFGKHFRMKRRLGTRSGSI